MSIFAKLRELESQSINEELSTEQATEQVSEQATEQVSVSEEVEDIYEEVELYECACGCISEGSVCQACGADLDEESKYKVVDGKVVRKKKRVGPKRKLTAAQKAALAKARKKAHSASAQKQRAKSLKKSKAVNEEYSLQESVIEALGLTNQLNESFGDDIEAKIQYLKEEYSIVF